MQNTLLLRLILKHLPHLMEGLWIAKAVANKTAPGTKEREKDKPVEGLWWTAVWFFNFLTKCEINGRH